MEQRFSEKVLTDIGATVVKLLREHSQDINKALSDMPEEDVGKGIKIGLNVGLAPLGESLFSTIKIKFATGKKVADSAVVDPTKPALPGI